VFYGFSLYIKNDVSLDAAKLADWLCFIRNIISNVPIDSYVPFVSAKKHLDEFALKSGSIYSHLNTLETANTGFSLEQMKEEIEKAKIYTKSPEAKQLIQEIENCNFCRGRVGFVFECLDITNSVPDVARLEKMKDILFEHLNENDISNDFRRALLTVADNCYYTFWQASAHIPDGYIDYGPLMDKPQYCLITARNKENDKADIRNFAQKAERRYLKMLLMDNILTNGKKLREIIEEFEVPPDMPSWKQLLIKEDRWLELDGKNPRFLIIDGDHAFLRQSKKAWYPDEIK
jgi:DNA-binding PadR family transcriptional regulator